MQCMRGAAASKHHISAVHCHMRCVPRCPRPGHLLRCVRGATRTRQMLSVCTPGKARVPRLLLCRVSPRARAAAAAARMAAAAARRPSRCAARPWSCTCPSFAADPAAPQAAAPARCPAAAQPRLLRQLPGGRAAACPRGGASEGAHCGPSCCWLQDAVRA